jgi:hypothetical protein
MKVMRFAKLGVPPLTLSEVELERSPKIETVDVELLSCERLTYDLMLLERSVLIELGVAPIAWAVGLRVMATIMSDPSLMPYRQMVGDGSTARWRGIPLLYLPGVMDPRGIQAVLPFGHQISCDKVYRTTVR